MSASIDVRHPERTRASHRHWGEPVVGGFYLSMGGVHLGLSSRRSRDLPALRRCWSVRVRSRWLAEHLMAYPTAFGLLLAAGEAVLGILLLLGGRAATYGWAGVVGFHLLLMLFGFGIWLWCIPALAVLIHLARLDTTTVWAARASRNAPAPGEST